MRTWNLRKRTWKLFASKGLMVVTYLTEEKGNAGPATRLVKLAKECEKRSCARSPRTRPRRTLRKYCKRIIKSRVGILLSFHSSNQLPVDENAPEFKLCIDDILHRIRNMGPVVDSNEAMRCEYISTIHRTAASLLEGLVISHQMI